MSKVVRGAAVAAVRAWSGAEPVAVEAESVGASNAVFYVTTASGDQVVARAARRPMERFEMERLVMGWARDRGLAVPAVHTLVPINDVSVMITDRLPGRRLADSSGVESSRIAEQCGEILAVIHSIPTEGFGNIQADGTGPRPTLEGWFLDDLQPIIDRAASVCDREAKASLDDVVSHLERSRSALQSVVPRLTHGDFSPMNLLVDGRGVSGIVDWESAKSGPAAFDFGWWDWFAMRHGTPFTADDMLISYRRRHDVDVDQLTELRRLVVLRVTVGNLAWAAERADRSAIEQAMAMVKGMNGR